MLTKFFIPLPFLLLALTCPLASQAAGETIVVSAEGLVDPQSPAYQRDKGVMIDALRADAKRQIIEKAVGTMVEGSTLIQNYEMINDQVLSKTAGLIKHVIKESSPWQGEDGFTHMLMKAEVYIADVRDALKTMSRTERLALLKQYDNPKISVAVFVKDANRRVNTYKERSDIAENILKEHIKGFGYRVWSEENTQKLKMELMESSVLDNQTDVTVSVSHMKAADFSIAGMAKFKTVSARLKASGLVLTKYVLTSWTVKCIDNYTGEEIYFNNNVPRRKSWADEDAALEDIGYMIGNEFSQDFFEQHLMAPSRIFQLQVLGLPDFDVAKMVKKELIGLRPVLNVDLRNYDSNGLSLYEVEFAGSRSDFQTLINDTLVYPLNRKLGERMFQLASAKGGTVRVNFDSRLKVDQLMQRFNAMPPSSLASATPARLKTLVSDKKTMEKVAAINPEAVKQLASGGDSNAGSALKAVSDF